MKTYYELEGCKSLTEGERIILEHLYRIFDKQAELVKTITEEANGDLKKVLEAAKELQYIQRYNGELSLFKEQFWDIATPKTLSMIVNQEKFIGGGFSNPEFTIPLAVLKKFNSFDEIRSDNPKSLIAKKLGAKLLAV